ncbi:hypothetical protein V7x_52060 [Crateriforma conspicua]|uniref:Uncharacterized protein n=2 Tax=Planctomycetaceae TaxID=126 RepID=A0A5C6FSH8_9PLAN|nr:hypothetical protein V7x_52060 [Crateriforma conspicua]
MKFRRVVLVALAASAVVLAFLAALTLGSPRRYLFTASVKTAASQSSEESGATAVVRTTPETGRKNVIYTVTIPIREKRSKTVSYTVMTVVRENRTRIDPVTGDEITYTVTRHVPEQREKTISYVVTNMVATQRQKTVELPAVGFEATRVPR